FYPVLVHRLAHLIHASFRPRLAAVALASSLGLHLHHIGQRTFASRLLNMPSTQRSRWRGGRYAWDTPRAMGRWARIQTRSCHRWEGQLRVPVGGPYEACLFTNGNLRSEEHKF